MAHQVVVIETGDSFDVTADETILQAATRQGVRIHSECEFGGCGTCRIQVVKGIVQYEDDFLPMSVSDDEHAQGYAAACQARLTQDIEISLANHIVTLPETQQLTLHVSEVRSLCSGICQLTLQGDALRTLQYWPGQYLNIDVGDGRQRSFSIANANSESGLIHLHIREIEGGLFTQQRLSTLQAGDPLQVTLPLGTFYYREKDWRPMVFVATGTGIAPLRAILESLLDDEDCPPISLYWGMRNEHDLYQQAEFEAWASRLDDFEFIPVLSQPGAGWQGRTGYVQNAVSSDFGDLSEHAIYLCGSPDMINEARGQFIERGAEADYIYADAFNFQHELTPQQGLKAVMA
ncbi:2Fe-2S iron-sulfur cluster-binding protein [Paenalcaligenes niemegkensis]|uniref:2Fe-2S iron-sulfur cluster-binding protein n=1 Tax=Paenalcaligenes niemegkensis TaxID=2895469 RepID=UPI001EE7E027|nr:2Fe-2S iron-sulfur cluster-binding protein [Paenalcaligenes niemegkensis]MCQ9617746.1 2Fe-2S iron-sulfur cluster-binding protein [Paenalcaligenes niemegkensis]